MRTELHPINANLPGVLSISARPRGGDWLEDEIVAWKAHGVDRVVSLLESVEAADLGLEIEGEACLNHGLGFTSFAIPDRSVPGSDAEAADLVDSIARDLSSRRNVLIHCRQGIGRAASIAAAVLVENGWTPQAAIARITEDRGLPVPETTEQRQWIERFTPAKVLGFSR